MLEWVSADQRYHVMSFLQCSEMGQNKCHHIGQTYLHLRARVCFMLITTIHKDVQISCCLLSAFSIITYKKLALDMNRVYIPPRYNP